MNLLSYEHTKDAVTNNNNQDGYISLIEKRAGSRRNLFSWLSIIEYRFIPIPLNIQANINYTHTYSPVYNFDELSKAKLNGIRFMVQATTFYKRGFNGKVQWLLDRQNYKRVPIQNKITNNNLLGMLSWQNAKFYASVNARYNKYK